MRNLFKANSQLGTLLLDSLTAIAILAIVFAVSYPNYARARQQASVGVDAQQLDSINTAVTLYANEHKGAYPAPGSVSTTVPGAAYLPVSPTSPLGAAPYNIGSSPTQPATYVIVDPNPPADQDLLGNYKNVAGGQCAGAGGLYLAEDSVHGVFCALTAQG